MYRRRLAGMAPSDLGGSDLTSFLQDLEMRLEVVERTRGDRARAVQLINKTNQFNLNGRRVTDAEIEQVLSTGGRLFTATLRDRNGSHGEILACVVTPEGVIRSLVMSCRVLQRRVEFAFLAWLAEQQIPVKLLEFEATQRNEPFRNFLRQAGVPFRAQTGAEMLPFDAQRFHDEHGVAALRLFSVDEVADAAAVTQG
jgi:FkbH-like protein